MNILNGWMMNRELNNQTLFFCAKVAPRLTKNEMIFTRQQIL